MQCFIKKTVAVCLLLVISFHNLRGQKKWDDTSLDLMLTSLMKEGDIPGMSIVIIDQDKTIIKNYGFADVESEKPVTSQTQFELGSCSKAFTALAVTLLERQGKIKLEDKVSQYLPWFKITYKDKEVDITIGQLLHHTSGISWNTLSKIPATNQADALERTVQKLNGQKLHYLPGKEYEYATVNYDILALIVQQVTHQRFETYVKQKIFEPLALDHTFYGSAIHDPSKARGYKVGFLKARPYDAPVYRGNNAAGYVVTNANDISRWLQLQLGILDSDIYPAVQSTHERDETVALHHMAAYARGWEISLNGTGEIFHGGLNPNFSSYIILRPKQKMGVAILANSNSSFTPLIAQKTMKTIAGESLEDEVDPGDRNDKVYSMLSFVMVLYILVVISFIGWIMVDVYKGKRKYDKLTPRKIGRFVLSLSAAIPFLYGIYLVPEALAGFSWHSTLVWMPVSFGMLLGLAVLSIGISYVALFVSLCFTEPNKYRRMTPRILLMSILSGLSNVAVIIMVTSSLGSDTPLRYLIFYYGLILCIYLLGRRFVQVSLIKFTRGLVCDLRIQLIDKIFATSYQRFEKMDRGKVYTALNDDISTIGESTNIIVMLITSMITAIGAFVYLASIAFWATAITVFIIVALAATYYFVSTRTNVYFEMARDSRDVFMRLINGMLDGFKELSLHRSKILQYKKEVADSAIEFRDKISTADIRFVNAFLVGESLLVILLGMISFGMPEFFPGVQLHTIMSFVIILLYLIGPINTILSSVPSIMNLNVSWKRVNKFIEAIPANVDLSIIPAPVSASVESIRAENLIFTYPKTDDHDFSIGPINLEVRKGEILFIIGGNGSGKTTLAKLLTGLYTPKNGRILINDRPVSNTQLSEHFSTVFSPSYLFEKLYSLNLEGKEDDVKKYLKVLDLEQKVSIADNQYSTINLSGGQRKRLALLQCYLENSPIYLFDEWAADQDPDYRNFFYRHLLPEMRAAGKIILAVTHDDHYFDVADRVLKMVNGKLEDYTEHVKEIASEKMF